MSETANTPLGTPVAFLGLGAMGSRMATRLSDAGFPLTVWNRSPERATELADRGATVSDTPAGAVAEADIVLVMVRDDEASREVWVGDHGAHAEMRDGAIAIDCSTLSPSWVTELGMLFSERGVDFLEAPVVGTRPHAEGGLLNVLAGGEARTLDRARPVLEAFSAAIHHAGPVGTGSRMKLAVNTLFALQVAALAEWLAALPRDRVELERALEILNALPTASPAAKRAGELIASGHTAPNFPVELVRKDLAYAVDALRGAGVEPYVADGAVAAFDAAVERGLGELDIVSIARLHASDPA